jgi:hypothetical protein
MKILSISIYRSKSKELNPENEAICDDQANKMGLSARKKIKKRGYLRC